MCFVQALETADVACACCVGMCDDSAVFHYPCDVCAEACSDRLQVLDFFRSTYPNNMTFTREVDEWRAYLGRFGISGRLQVLFPPAATMATLLSDRQ